MTAEQYLRSILPTRRVVRDFLSPSRPDGTHPNRGWTYDAELGWVHADAVHEGDGIDGSRTFYRYEKDGARRVVNFPDRPCRIHTFGDSFTHCDQVNDGETWQEYLAAHLQEPIRNYGVGGYSVYQAFRRMKRVESDPRHRAGYVILNIFDDDHFRNLDSWRRLRLGHGTLSGFTLPHLRVNLNNGTFEERDNLLQQPRDVYKLCDSKWVTKTFRDDPILKLVLAMTMQQRQPKADHFEAVAVSFGLPPQLAAHDRGARTILKVHTDAALFATQCVLQMTETFLRARGIKLMVVLSFGQENMAATLEGTPRFDESLLRFLKRRRYPVIDTRDHFLAEFRQSKRDAPSFVREYYNSHHSPRGNFFTAMALKDRVVEWLKPRPLPYR